MASFITNKDLEIIKQYLIENGIKDSQFEEQTQIRSDDWITLVGIEGNKKLKIETLLNLIIKEGQHDFNKSGVMVVDTLEELENFDAKIHGNLVYVRETDSYYSYSKTGQWEQILKVYVGHEEPKDPNVLWIDLEDNTTLSAPADNEVLELQRQVQELTLKVKDISRLVTTGIVPGDVKHSYRRAIMSTAEPIKPDGVEGDEEEDDSEWKPDTEVSEPTVFHNTAKQDTSTNFAQNKQDLVDGEMLFYTDKKKFVIYYGGKFYTASSGGNTGGGSGVTAEELQDLALDHMTFACGTKQFRARCNSDGIWTVTEYNAEETAPGSPLASWGVYVEHLLCINSIFCGGKSSEEALVSHNFVELANGSKEDINLKGLYLLYTDGSKENASDIGYIWKVLPLEGVIKAGSTFLIRGNQCNTLKASMIKVDSSDMEWSISFNQGNSSFYLCAGTGFQELLDNNTLGNPWVKNQVKVGYIDSCGFGEGSVGEGSKQFLVDSDWNKVLFVRWFMLEPAKQGNKAYAARQTTALWTYIDLERQSTREGNSIQYYYPDYMKERFAPMASTKGKTFFTNKTTFNPRQANYLNTTFGIQATDNGNGATRCFNWISVGYYDEYVEIRKKGTSDWTRHYSITEKNSSNTATINKFIEHYKRLRWIASDGTIVTTHKCIVSGLTKGDYEYRVGRDDDPYYVNKPLEFKVLANSDVTSFTYAQVTDQQGFNWAEYQAWKKSAMMLSREEQDIQFTINTGDITQSGNRVNEWLDYYDGRKYLNNLVEMFSIGNNDLCGHNATELTNGEDATSKYNHINVLRYFTFELDPDNTYEVEWNGVKYPIYSLYSFNYGDFHFVSLNSEIAIASSKMYKDWSSDTYAGDRTFAEAANAQIEAWFIKDLQKWSGEDTPTDCAKCIVYMHEMPFTIVTYDFMQGSGSRAGSHLNTLNANGNYRFSRLFKKFGIRLVMGGHKHTYCLSKPIYDAPSNYITAANKIDSTIDIMGAMEDSLSRKPVIQVTSAKDVQTNDYARYEVVDKITAPTYVMSQATGYKLVSNKEQPSGNAYTIPWLLAYFKASTNASSPTENVAQHKPMYIRYDVTPTEIKVTATQVENVWNVNIEKNTKSIDMNKQLSDLSVTKMTLSTTSNEDIAAYNITDIKSYTITL